jgi:dsDNA-binding SOS-regulon protein
MSTLLDLYQNLKQKLIKEKTLITAEDFEKLEILLKEKNEIIEKIKKDESKSSVQAAESKKAKTAVSQKIEKVLASIVKAQAQNIELLSQKKGETKTKILELYSRQKSIKGYHNPGQQEAKFFDEQS